MQDLYRRFWDLRGQPWGSVLSNHRVVEIRVHLVFSLVWKSPVTCFNFRYLGRLFVKSRVSRSALMQICVLIIQYDEFLCSASSHNLDQWWFIVRWIPKIKLDLRIGGHCITYWGRMTHICGSKLTIISSDNGLSPRRRQAIIWTSDGILLIGPVGTSFSEILIEVYTFSFRKIHFKTTAILFRPQFVKLQRICHRGSYEFFVWAHNLRRYRWFYRK